MEPVKTMGIVIRSAVTGDYNKMLTVISRDLGRISVWAKGVKSPKHPCSASASLLCYSEFILSKKKDIFTLSAATLEEGFYGIRNSLDKLSHAMYFASLAENVCQEGESEEILRLLLNTLHYAEKEKKKLMDLRLMYELKLLTYSGFCPNTCTCSVCGGKALYFEPSLGGAICENCKKPSSKIISANTLSLMNYYITSPLSTSLAFVGQIDAVKEGLIHTEGFILHHIGRINALDYLKSVTE